MWQRKPGFAGSFYPASPEKLKNEIAHYLSKAEIKKLDNPVAFISPHAGYIYSGPVAAYSYVQLKENPVDVAIVLAPSHRARFNGASVISNGIFTTPLGDIKVDTAITDRLLDDEIFLEIKEAHQYEHSLEVQLPFLQVVLQDFVLVPIVIGTIDLEICRQIGNKLAEALGNESRKFVIIVSTDLSHYYSYDIAKKIDNNFIEALKKFDESYLFEMLQSDKAQACGEGPVLAGMVASKKLGAKKVEILHYANSGDTAGPKNEVVGYLAAAFVK
ncbi:MAG: AmmeMemoRadiSam system protein B [Spirochaetes bacterium]|nr:AmmeMemoRadiSam system protein B [Spirochaetota bacterium]